MGKLDFKPEGNNMISTRLRVKELLRERRWTTKVLAEKTGMSESYLTHIKNGTRRWNEDALKKIAEAFELMPTQLLEQSGDTQEDSLLNISPNIAEQAKNFNLKLQIVPVVGQIPQQPSEYNNQQLQISTGYTGKFVPVLNELEDKSMFCLCLEDGNLAPQFNKGDYLIVSPGMWTNSGDIVAVEYGNENPQRSIMRVNFMDDFVVLETVNHKVPPIALARGKDQFRILGKVIFRYQRLP